MLKKLDNCKKPLKNSKHVKKFKNCKKTVKNFDPSSEPLKSCTTEVPVRHP